MNLWERASTGDPVADIIIEEHSRIMMQAGMPSFGLIWRVRRFAELILFEALKDTDSNHRYVKQMESRGGSKKPSFDQMFEELKGEFPDPLFIKEVKMIQEVGNLASHFQVEFNPAERLWKAVNGPLNSLVEWILTRKVGKGNYHLLAEYKITEFMESFYSAMLNNFPVEDGELIFEGDTMKRLTHQLKGVTANLAPNLYSQCLELAESAIESEHEIDNKKLIIEFAILTAFVSPSMSLLRIMGERKPELESNILSSDEQE
jgi:hypothetical protein